MAYTQYYYQPADEVLSSSEINAATGVNPETYGYPGLNSMGIYGIIQTTQPFNTDLYTVQRSFVITNYPNGAPLPDGSTGAAGDWAVEDWAATDKPLSEAITAGRKIRINTISGRLDTIQRASGYTARIINAMRGEVQAARAARYNGPIDRAISTADELDANLTAIEGAAAVDDINNIVSAAWGDISIAVDKANPLDLLESDMYEFNSKDYAKTDLELYFPSTTTIVTYNGGFPATAGVITADDPTVQLRVKIGSVVIDEFRLYEEDATAFAANKKAYSQAFGYKVYEENGGNSPFS